VFAAIRHKGSGLDSGGELANSDAAPSLTHATARTNMQTDPDASALRTRSSLLLRLKNWDDEKSWQEFDGMYRKLVYGYSRRSGLSHEEAEEVTNDVFVRVAKTIQDFESNPEKGSFRGWLMNLARWRVGDKFRSRPKDAQAPHRDVPDDGTSTIERIQDPHCEDELWDKEWQERLLDTAFERIAKRAQAKHVQVFELHFRQHWSVLKISRSLGTNPASVYLINHRLTKQLAAEVAKLRERLG
jgi:RNA polymerase sigma-70 factor (ECF subfamily)